MITELPDFFDKYNGEYYYNRAIGKVISSSQYNALSATGRAGCVKGVMDIDPNTIARYKISQVGCKGEWDEKEDERAYLRLMPSYEIRTPKEQVKFAIDYKYALMRFIMEKGIPKQHMKDPYVKVYCNGDVHLFHLEDLYELDMYKFALSPTDKAVDTLYVKGLISSELVLPVIKNEEWTTIPLGSNMAAQFIEAYKKKIREYIEIRNRLVQSISDADVLTEEKDGIVKLWSEIFGTTQLYGNVETIKI